MVFNNINDALNCELFNSNSKTVLPVHIENLIKVDSNWKVVKYSKLEREDEVKDYLKSMTEIIIHNKNKMKQSAEYLFFQIIIMR